MEATEVFPDTLFSMHPARHGTSSAEVLRCNARLTLGGRYSPRIMETPPQASPLRILVVDDESAVREVLSTCLKGGGHTVETATDGAAGWQQFQNGNWDVVLTDRVMPGMTGEQLATAIKQVAPHMPVVLVTGLADQSIARVGVTSPVDLRKPFTLATLRNAINDARALHVGRQDAA